MKAMNDVPANQIKAGALWCRLTEAYSVNGGCSVKGGPSIVTRHRASQASMATTTIRAFKPCLSKGWER